MVSVPPAGAEQEVTSRSRFWMLTTWPHHLTSPLIQIPTIVNEKVIELSSPHMPSVSALNHQRHR